MRYIDIVIPKGNEKDFIQMAERLGYSDLCFLYPIDKYKVSEFKTKLNIHAGIITKNVQKARNMTNLVVTNETEKIREIVERYRPDILIGMEKGTKRDYMHQRNSGLNHIICKIANQKNVAFGISFSEVLESKNKDVLIGRIKQNIMLYNKYKNSVLFASFAEDPYDMRGPRDMISFLSILGMKAPKRAMNEAINIINRNSKKGLIAEGVEIVGAQ